MMILSYVKGYKIEFEDQPHQINIPKQINLNDKERHIIENESQKLLSNTGFIIFVNIRGADAKPLGRHVY
jgi:hypothetical protein